MGKEPDDMVDEWGKGLPRKIATLLLLFLVLLLAGTACASSSSGPAVSPRQVLVIHSYHLGFKWTDEMTQGITAALREEGKGVQVRYDYMDTKHVADPAYFELLYATYRHKYYNEKFAVIIATDNDAFTFLKAHRDLLFPATPVIFCGVNYFQPSQLEGKQLFTGVNETADIRSTLDLALQLHPATRQIVVINDTTTTGRIVQREVQSLIPVYQGRVKFLFLEELAMSEILETVQKLGPESLVFYGLFFQDKTGSFYEYDEGIALIAASSPVPVYGVWDFYLGYGLLGGMLTSGYNQGETAGRMALRVLRGETTEAIPVVMKSPNRYMFDYRQLQRFDIAISALPAGSIIINQPSSLYAVPRPVFWGAVAALAASAVIIALLLYNTAIRRRAEHELQRAALKYRIVADNTYNWEFWLDPAGYFLYTSPSCKQITGRDAEEFHTNPQLMAEMIHPDDRPLWSNHRHDVTAAKVSAGIEFRLVRPNGQIRWISHVCLPVFDDNGKFIGTRGSFSDITNRKQAEERNLRLAAIVDSSDDAIIGKTLEGIITSWNKGAEKIYGYSEKEVLGTSIAMRMPAEYQDEVFQVHDKIRRGEHIEHFETVRTRKDGERINMSLTYSPVRDGEGRVVAVSTIARDITEQKKAERLLLDHVRVNRELEIAQEIQQSFLSACPAQLPGLLMACCCKPATHVGGDYYDFFTPEIDLVDLVVADITGHSLGAALLMTETRSVLRAKVSAGRSPGKLLAAVNDLLYDDLCRAELQISMFYARLETETSTLLYANAGHNRPLLYRSQDGTLEELDSDGLLLGIKCDISFEEQSRGVMCGDILLLYTDGVTEAENTQEEVFGVERLGQIIAAQSQCHPQKIIDSILAGLAAFSGAKPRSDDVTMVAIKIS
jgi:sigma-B regulation protein RsbU (phosphoserine phosphatase)